MQKRSEDVPLKPSSSLADVGAGTSPDSYSLSSAASPVLTHSWTTPAMKLIDEDKEASAGIQNGLLVLPISPKQFVQAKWEICARS